MNIPLGRVPDKGPAHLYTTFGIRTKESEHWRQATCEETNCGYYIKGFNVEVDESKPIGEKNAVLLRQDKTRSPKESHNEYGMTVFSYPPGTNCMNKHQVRIPKPEIFIVKGGDHRGNPKGTPTRIHTKAEFWVEEFAEVQDKIKTQVEKRD